MRLEPPIMQYDPSKHRPRHILQIVYFSDNWALHIAPATPHNPTTFCHVPFSRGVARGVGSPGVLADAGAGARAGASSFRARFATCPAYCAKYAIFCSID